MSDEVSLCDVDLTINLACGPVLELSDCAVVYHRNFVEILQNGGCQLIPWHAIRVVSIIYPRSEP